MLTYNVKYTIITKEGEKHIAKVLIKVNAAGSIRENRELREKKIEETAAHLKEVTGASQVYYTYEKFCKELYKY